MNLSHLISKAARLIAEAERAADPNSDSPIEAPEAVAIAVEAQPEKPLVPYSRPSHPNYLLS